jgi:hypothetical protein
MLETHMYVDKKQVEKQRREINIHRQQVQKKYIQTEIEVLQHGERTPVLDIWRLNPALAKRHLFFQDIETIWLDPMSKELWIRIQLGDLQIEEGKYDIYEKQLFANLFSFLTIIASDAYLQIVKKYISIVVLELYTYREDEVRNDVPFPFFSMVFNVTVLQQLPYGTSGDPRRSPIFVDIIFNGCREIIPHRGIDGPMLRGMK